MIIYQYQQVWILLYACGMKVEKFVMRGMLIIAFVLSREKIKI